MGTFVGQQVLTRAPPVQAQTKRAKRRLAPVEIVLEKAGFRKTGGTRVGGGFVAVILVPEHPIIGKPHQKLCGFTVHLTPAPDRDTINPEENDNKRRVMMSLTLDLEPEVEISLREAAAAEGISINELLARTFPPQIAKSSPRDHVQALLTRWQEQDQSPVAALVTSSEALFHKWDQEDAALTDAEQQTRAEQWELFQQGINAERTAAGMRLVF